MERNISEDLIMIIATGSKIDLKEYEINQNTRLIEDLGFDSLEMMQMIVDIENHFGIEFDSFDMYLDNINTYGRLLEYIKNEVNKEK